MEIEPDILKELETQYKKKENLLSEYASKNAEF
jgi:hypothetical protein